MPALHIRDLTDAVIAALRARARRHHRSLQGEVRRILEEVADAERRATTGSRRPLRLHTVRVGQPPSFSREVIYGD